MEPDSVYLYVSRGNAYLMKGDRARARAGNAKRVCHHFRKTETVASA
jgi:hypothetical protein